jgi:hypothetical protein
MILNVRDNEATLAETRSTATDEAKDQVNINSFNPVDKLTWYCKKIPSHA